MATATYVKGAKTSVDFTASGSSYVVDEIIELGTNANGCVGVAFEAIADGATGTVHIDGVYQFPKVSGAVIVQGETVDWDTSAGEVDDNQATSATGDISDFGVALESRGNGTTTVIVKLLPGNGAIN